MNDGIYGQVIVWCEEDMFDAVTDCIADMVDEGVAIRHSFKRMFPALSVEIQNDQTYQTAVEISRIPGVVRLEDNHRVYLPHARPTYSEVENEPQEKGEPHANPN